MKMIAKKIIQMVAYFFRIVCPYKVCYSIQFVWINHFRSYWLHSCFENCHKTALFGKIGRVHGAECISIAEKTFFDDYFYLTAWPELVKKKPSLKIGKNCNFGAYNHITCTNEITIGNNVLTGKWVTISDNNHGDTTIESLLQEPLKRSNFSKGPIIIEDNVWIGDKATILSGVHIGKGAVIAANAVVTKDISEFCVAVGNPAKIINRV